MGKSEIDDIFASKGKVPVPSTSAPSASSSKAPAKSKKKSKKRAREEAEPGLPETAPKPAVVPETVVDTSSMVMPPQKRVKKDKKEKKVSKAAPEEQADFGDSRGSSSRRQTDEGWTIYKEDELGMSTEGGDTPLCPFDCECCY
ncbi:DUF1764-domain-containing protein [Cylindrobasidium torrendii FP15055 ss-10]|uniref:DUF1764-domain-containing protein n=1 Tax=Cylindrobasidium torrendii FP15055 ss-10 TaxID=1314674 RepID=A0A0D7B281_9AGAR|nr:DUF1764-domain-containing protein [Cylindrobasidium torrendii FP15055 ss-10]